MLRRVLVACLLTHCPCTTVFSLTKPLRARNALLAYNFQTKSHSLYMQHKATNYILGTNSIHIQEAVSPKVLHL